MLPLARTSFFLLSFRVTPLCMDGVTPACFLGRGQARLLPRVRTSTPLVALLHADDVPRLLPHARMGPLASSGMDKLLFDPICTESFAVPRARISFAFVFLLFLFTFLLSRRGCPSSRTCFRFMPLRAAPADPLAPLQAGSPNCPDVTPVSLV